MLKDLTTTQAADVLVQIAPFIDNITQDEELLQKIGKAIKRDGMTKIGLQMEAMHRVFSSVPVLFGTHRNDIFGIIAAVKFKTVDEVANQSIVDTKKDIEEILKDEDFISFFGSFGWQGKSE